MDCKHFGQCGSCSHAAIAYEDQLKEKMELTKEFLSPYASEEAFHEIVASPEQWAYRNKMEYSFGRDKESRKMVCGLHRKDIKRAIVDMETCPLFGEDAVKVCNALADYANKYNLSYFSTYGHKGFVRYVVIRKTVANKELMVNFVVSSQGELNKEEIIESLTALDLEHKLSSLYITISDAKSDAVIPEQVECIYGSEFITEEVNDLSFKIYPFTFFQVNPKALPSFYESFVKAADLKETDEILDIYCGVGTISSILSPHCRYVWGIEFSQDSVDSAFENAKENKINNVSFMAGDAKVVLHENLATWTNKMDAVVVNPPRSGIAPKAAKKIIALNAPKIIYSSCNVKTMAQNMEQFSEFYDLLYVKPFDFFPQTKHFEVLTVLKRKD